jgi:2-phospho-L-lactate guanylyltransferase
MPGVAPSRARPGPAGRWTLVLPLKGGPGAKSRLRGGPELARAIAGDCLDAVLACPAVTRTVVVTAHGPTGAAATAAGALVVAESAPGSGLMAAIRDGLAGVSGGLADVRTGPVGVLLGDLPALRPADLHAGLAAVETALGEHPAAPMAVVPDAAGTGTVLLAARTVDALAPAFGADSLAEHVRRGALRVDLDSPRLRQDVDTLADLLAAVTLGVGPRTAAAVAADTRSVGRALARLSAQPATPGRQRTDHGTGACPRRTDRQTPHGA